MEPRRVYGIKKNNNINHDSLNNILTTLDNLSVDIRARVDMNILFLDEAVSTLGQVRPHKVINKGTRHK